jgi:hypothetical protein
MHMQRASLTVIWVVIATLFLAACGGNEEQERAAFVEFLQTRIIDKPGIHVPKLTDEEKAAFGPYADHYAVITNFNAAMDESISPKMQAVMRDGAIRSLSDVVSAKPRLETARAGINEMNGALTQALAEADAARAALEQPEDLKPVYDKAYARLVTEPATAFRQIVPVMNDVLGKAIELGTYIEANRARVRLNGPMIETSDPKIQNAINERIESLQSHQQAVQSAQRRMMEVVQGAP